MYIHSCSLLTFCFTIKQAALVAPEDDVTRRLHERLVSLLTEMAEEGAEDGKKHLTRGDYLEFYRLVSVREINNGI